MADPYNLHNLRNLLGDGWEDVVNEAIETIDHLRTRLERVTAELNEARCQRDNYCSRWLRAGAERDQARKEVAAMEAECGRIRREEAWSIRQLGEPTLVDTATRRVLDALKRAREAA